MESSSCPGSHAPFKDQIYDEAVMFDIENSLDSLPGTPIAEKCTINDTESEKEQSQSNHSSSTTNTTSSSNRRGPRFNSETILSRIGSFVNVNESVKLEDLFEYDWADSDCDSPSKGTCHTESYIIQELLADHLNIKSFKRKYPDLPRRTMDAYERSWLQQEGLVRGGRADLGLTALRTEDVMKLLQQDYPDVFTSLDDLFRRRRFQKIALLQKQQYEAARIERGEARAEAARRRALDSAVDFNHRLVASRVKSRRCYWDLQTMQIHLPQPPYKLITHPTDADKPSYPVALLPGQFADYYVPYSSAEQLMHLPLNRCLYSKPVSGRQQSHQPTPDLPSADQLRFGSFDPRPKSPQGRRDLTSPQPSDSLLDGTGDVNDGDVAEGAFCKRDSNHNQTNMPTTSPDQRDVSHRKSPGNVSSSTVSEIKSPTSPSHGKKKTPGHEEKKTKPTCAVCRKPGKLEAKRFTPFLLLTCSDCGRSGHSGCLGISKLMLATVKSYAWSCMECKRCVKCNDSGHEDKLMFCDQCDRGYHAFCLGLDAVPDGNWICQLCLSTPKPSRRKSEGSRRRRSQGGNSKHRPSDDDQDSSNDDDGGEEELKPPRKRRVRSEVAASTEGKDCAKDTVKRRPRGRPPRQPSSSKLEEQESVDATLVEDETVVEEDGTAPTTKETVDTRSPSPKSYSVPIDVAIDPSDEVKTE